MDRLPKFYGLVTVGARGQIVIPAQVRKLLNIKSGDKLMVSAGCAQKKMVQLIPEAEFTQFLANFEKHISSLKTGISGKGRENA